MIGSEPLISVIVPVYNVEKCIEATLLSIEEQTYSNIEVVLVDDGSTDSSGKICDAWASQDGRFAVVHKQNGGLSSARNAGLERARGQYISFVDGDDLLDSRALESLLAALIQTSSDVAIGSLQKLREGTRTFETDYTDAWEVIDSEECLKRLLFCNGISVSACGKLYSSTIWSDNRFPDGSYYEDIATIPISLASCKRICTTDTAVYGYVTRSGSITGTGSLSEKKYHDAQSELKRLEYFLQTKTVSLKDATNYFLTFTWLRLFRYIPRQDGFIDSDEYKRMQNNLRKKASMLIMEKRSTRMNRMRLLLFSISPALYELVFRLYSHVFRLNVI